MNIHTVLLVKQLLDSSQNFICLPVCQQSTYNTGITLRCFSPIDLCYFGGITFTHLIHLYHLNVEFTYMYVVMLYLFLLLLV